MEILEKLFGSAARVKVMRLFLANPEIVFDAKTIQERTGLRPEVARREVAMLGKIGLLKESLVRTQSEGAIAPVKKKKSKKVSARVKRGWAVNPSFVYRAALENLLINMLPLSARRLSRQMEKAGRIKLIIVAGAFIQEWDKSRVDILVVGDKLKGVVLERTIKNLEAEIGRELSFAAFETRDFLYRLGVCDRLIRDILEYPHKKVVDKLGVEEPKDVLL